MAGLFPNRTETRGHPELERYLRLEYGRTLGVSAFLADLARSRETPQAKARKWLRNAIERVAARLASTAALHRRKVPSPEV